MLVEYAEMGDLEVYLRNPANVVTHEIRYNLAEVNPPTIPHPLKRLKSPLETSIILLQFCMKERQLLLRFSILKRNSLC